LAEAILDRRDWVVVLGTKPKDASLDKMRKAGWHKVERWPAPAKAHRVLLWPPFKKPEYEAKQAEVAREAFEDIFEKGGWCIYLDEVAYVADDLGQEVWLRRFWRQGRSLGITVVAATQRPAWVPVDMYTMASYLFVWRTNEKRDLDRLAGLGAADSATVRQVVQSLPRYHVLFVDTREGHLITTKVEMEGTR